VDAVVPQNAGNKAQSQTSTHTTEPDAPVLSRITSGQDLLAQARTLTGYLREQPDGWLAAHRLMKSLRHDTLSAIPAPNAEGKHASNRRGLTSGPCSNGCTCSRAG
jgi:type VI secretion system protein VasJ